MRTLAKRESIDQAQSFNETAHTGSPFKDLSAFLDDVELGVRGFVRAMLQTYAEDEFLRYIGAKRYERTDNRRDQRNGHRTKKLGTRFGLIDDLSLPRGRKAGISYSQVQSRYRRQDQRIEEVVSEMFLRGVSTRKVGKISRLLWGEEISPAEVSRMNKRVRKELVRWLNRPITKKIAYLIVDGAYFKVRRKRLGREAALCAIGITEGGEREFLGFIPGQRESQQAWEFLLTHLVRRGLNLKGVLSVTSQAEGQNL